MSAGDSSPTSSYWLCPLYSFDCYSESVDLAEGIQIKNAPDLLDKVDVFYVDADEDLDLDEYYTKWVAFLPSTEVLTANKEKKDYYPSRD